MKWISLALVGVGESRAGPQITSFVTSSKFTDKSSRPSRASDNSSNGNQTHLRCVVNSLSRFLSRDCNVITLFDLRNLYHVTRAQT